MSAMRPNLQFLPTEMERNRADFVNSLLDVSMCAAVVLALLFNLFIGPLTPLTVFGFVVAFCVFRRDRIVRVFTASWPLLLLPVFALCSAAWSVYPEETLRYGLFYLVSVLVGVMMGAGVRQNDLLKGLFIGLLIYGVISLPAGRFVVVGNTGEMAFAGLLGSKNAAGEVAGVALLVSFAMLFHAWRERMQIYILASLLGIAVAAGALLLSKATGAIIAGTVSLFCLFLWAISARFTRQLRVAIFLGVAVALFVLVATIDFWLPPLFDLVLESSGKDAGLTGRDFLWRKADALIDERPFFGLGYSAFWVINNLDAEYLWRELGIANRSGFNFHNTYREITVALGYVGLTLFSLIAGISSLVLLVRTMLRPSTPMILASVLLVYLSFKLPFESFGFGGMNLLSMLAYTILAMGLSALLSAHKQAGRFPQSY